MSHHLYVAYKKLAISIHLNFLFMIIIFYILIHRNMNITNQTANNSICICNNKLEPTVPYNTNII